MLMETSNLSLIAELIEHYGILKVAVAMLLTGIAISFPIFISWLKELTKRKNENKLYELLLELGKEIKALTRQYSENISQQMVEILLEQTYQREFWALFDFIRGVIEKNDIENDKQGIEDRIRMEVKLAFKTITNDLVKFKYKNRNLTDFMACGDWEVEVYNTLIRSVFDQNKLLASKKISNLKMYLNTEFGNIHFLTMQNVNQF